MGTPAGFVLFLQSIDFLQERKRRPAQIHFSTGEYLGWRAALKRDALPL